MDNQQELQHQYKLLDSNSDYKDSKIEKSNIKVTFTLRDIETQIEYWNKKIKEMKAQVEVEKAKITNIEQFHAFVKDFDDKQLHAIGMYNDSKKIVNAFEPKIAEIEKAVQESEAEMKDITEKLGFAVPSTIA